MGFSKAPLFGLLLALAWSSTCRTETVTSASEILKDKWRHIFHYFVPEEDGEFTIEFCYELARRYQDLYPESSKSDAEGLLGASQVLEAAIHSLYGKEKLGVNMEEYVASFTHYFETEHEDYIQYWWKYFDAVFDVMDTNGDDYTSWDEFRRYYLRRDKAGGEIKLALSIFNLLDANGDRDISRDEHIDAYMTYLSSTSAPHEQLPLYE